MCFTSSLRFFERLIHLLKCAAQVRDRYRPADDQRHVEGVQKLFARHVLLDALKHVIRYAVIAPEHERRYEPEQLFRFGIERAAFLGLMIERKESLDAKMLAAQYSLVHLLAVIIEFVN